MKPTKMNDVSAPCPFNVGDTVYYRPHAHEKDVNQVPGGFPEIGQAVRITKIVRGAYVIYEGYTSSAGGIYWTEFAPK